MSKALSRASLIDSLAEEIEQQIIDGELGVGTKLDGEDALAEQYEVSRPVVREALVRLRERGYVQTVNGLGTFIREPNLDDVTASLRRHFQLQVSADGKTDLEGVYEARTAIEQETARLAAVRATDDDIRQLREYVEVMGRTALVDPVQYTKADVGFHLKIAESAHNLMFQVLLSPLIDVIVTGMIESVHEVREGMRDGHSEHQEIIRCIELRDPKGARETMIMHLRHSYDNRVRRTENAAT